MSDDRNAINTGGGSIDNRNGNIVQVRDIFIGVGAGATPRSAVELQPEEIVLLTRVLDSRDKSLLVWQADIGLMLLIDGQPISDPRDAEVAQLYIEGFQRLERYGLLVYAPGNGRVYNLSSEGRVLAKRLRGKCPWCSEPMDNSQTDLKQPPIWECNKPRCLHSTWHRTKRCEMCGKPPTQITSLGVGFASYRCEDGHSWTKKAGKE